MRSIRLTDLFAVFNLQGILDSSNTTKMRKDVFGYYDHEGQKKPTHDPGPDGLCPVCCWPIGKHHPVTNPVKTISVAAQDQRHRTRSFFFRAHKNCWGSTTPHNRNLIESSVIDEHIEATK